MKTILLFLLISISAFSQKKMVLIEGFQDSNYPEIANVIMEEFYSDAAKENFYPRTYIEQNLKGIYFVHATTIEKYVGKKNDNRAASITYVSNDLTGKTDVLILVDNSKIDNLQNVKAFVYHELGHFLGLDHELIIFPAIMNKQINGSFITEKTLLYYFQKLRNVPPNLYRKKL